MAGAAEAGRCERVGRAVRAARWIKKVRREVCGGEEGEVFMQGGRVKAGGG